MLDEKRIKEANTNIKQYLLDGLIKKEPFNQIVFDTLMKNHRESLSLVETIKTSNLWVIVISYYSMFYIANALLYKMGHKIGHRIAHKITADALIEFIRNKLKISLLEDYEEIKEEAFAGTKADELIKSFDNERSKRSTFQYETTEEIKKSKAETSLKRAKAFSMEIEKLIEKLS